MYLQSPVQQQQNQFLHRAAERGENSVPTPDPESGKDGGRSVEDWGWQMKGGGGTGGGASGGKLINTMQHILRITHVR